MKRRFLSLLLALCMVVSLLPGTARAAITSGTCGAEGSNVNWAYDDTTNVLTIEGSGAIADYEGEDDTPWHGFYDSLKKVVIGSGITKIGTNAFYKTLDTIEVFYLGDQTFDNAVDVSSGNVLITFRPVLPGCTVYYTPGNGIGSMASVVVEKGKEYELPSPSFTAPNNDTFAGWSVGATGTVAYPARFQYVVTGDTTFRALWKDGTFTQEYTITYSNVDDVVTQLPAASYAYSSYQQALLLTTPRRNGYTFTGWSYSLGDTSYPATRDPIIIPAGSSGGISLTAHWEGNSYAINFQDTDGSTLSQQQYTTKDQRQTVRFSIPSKLGYELDVTKIKCENASVSVTKVGNEILVSLLQNCYGDINLQTNDAWNLTKYNITFDLDGGVLSDNTAVSEVKIEYTIEDTGLDLFIQLPGAVSDDNVVKEGHIFTGWTCEGVEVQDAVEGVHSTVSLPLDTTGNLVFKAHWEPETYEVTYSSNGGEGEMEPSTATYGEPFTLPANGFTAPEGKEFGGWHIDGGAYDEKYEPITDDDGALIEDFAAGDVIYLKEATELTAIWKQIYTIKFDPNDGSGTMADQEAVEGADFPLPANGFTAPEGKVFWRWELVGADGSSKDAFYYPEGTAPEDGEDTYIVAAVDANADDEITFQAVWETLYRVTYTPNGGQGTMSSNVSIPEHEGLKLLPCGYTAPFGQTFKAWAIEGIDGEFQPYDPDDPNTIYSFADLGLDPDVTEITVKPIWEKDTFTVKYVMLDDEGNEAASYTEETAYGEQHTLLDTNTCKFTAPNGKEFDCWVYTDESGNVRERPVGFTLRITQKTTVITAKWKDIKYTIRFDPGEGSEGAGGPVAPIENVTYGSMFTFPACTYEPPAAAEDPDNPGETLPQKIFAGWEISYQDDNDVIQTRRYAAGATVEFDEFIYKAVGHDGVERFVTATAVWMGEDAFCHITYTSGYSANTETVEYNNVFPGLFTPLAECTFDAPGADMWFDQWSVAGHEIGKPGANYIFSDDTTVDALWRGGIQYDLGSGGTAEGNPESYLYSDGSKELELKFAPSRAGHIFMGWTCADTSVEISGSYVLLPPAFTGTLTLVAQWSEDENACIITFNANGGTGTMNPVPVARGDAYVLPENGFTAPAGMVFDCWQVSGDTERHEPGDTITVEESITVTALWKDDDSLTSYYILYVLGDGAVQPDGYPDTYEVSEEDYTFTLAPPTREGYIFSGWTCSKEEVALDSESGAVTIPANTRGNITFTAQWEEEEPPATYTVTYEPGEGSSADGEPVVREEVSEGEYLLETPEALGFTAPEGMVFDCWSVGSVRIEGASYNLTADTTFTAMWKEPDKDTFTVTFDAGGGSGTMASVDVPMGEDGTASYVLPSNGFTAPEGKEFKAWSVFGGEFAPGATITLEGDATVTALWQDQPVVVPPAQYTITFHANGGSGTMASVTVNENTAYALPACGFTAPRGQAFKAWNVGGTEYAPGATLTITSNIDVTAVWMSTGASSADGTYLINYWLDGGTASQLQTSYTVSAWEQTLRLSTPVRTGFTFLGWTYSEQPLPEPTVTLPANFFGDLFVTAVWEKDGAAANAGQTGTTGTTTPPVINSVPVSRYTDVAATDWYCSAVEFVSSRGLMTGTSDTRFSPKETMTRAMLWTVLARLDGSSVSTGGVWYEEGRSWAMNRGISDGTNPFSTITREEFVTMLWRYAGSPSATNILRRYGDGMEVSSWAADAVSWAASKSILSSDSGSLNPKSPATRADVAAILMRYCEYYNR